MLADQRPIKLRYLFVVLAVTGVLPFFYLSLENFFHSQNKLWLNLLLIYSAIVLSFLGGIQWGMLVRNEGHRMKFSASLLISSVSIALVAWILVTNQNHPGLCVIIFILAFTAVWLIDGILFLNTIIERWYFKLRSWVTLSVIALLALAIGR